jgi:hypothetical protein
MENTNMSILKSLEMTHSEKIDHETVMIPILKTKENDGQVLTRYFDIADTIPDHMIFERDKDLPDYFGKVYLIIDQSQDESYRYKFGAFISDSDIVDDKDAYSFEIIDANLTDDEKTYMESQFTSLQKIHADVNSSLAAYKLPSLDGFRILSEKLLGFDYYAVLTSPDGSKTVKITIANILNPASAIMVEVNGEVSVA